MMLGKSYHADYKQKKKKKKATTHLRADDDGTDDLIDEGPAVRGLGSVENEELLQPEQRHEDQQCTCGTPHHALLLVVGPQLPHHHPHNGQQEQYVDLSGWEGGDR